MIERLLSSLPRRRLGNSGLHVTVLGFGGAAVGNLYRPVSDKAAADSVHAALAQGVGLFDTAPFYGFGLSEMRLADALPLQDIVLSTKVGRVLVPEQADADLGAARHGFVSPMPLRPHYDYSYDGVMRSWEDSRKRLKRERIDILLAHDLGSDTHGDAQPARFAEFMSGGYRALRELRDGGAVDAIGLGVNEWQVCEQALEAGEFDCFLLAGRYTLLEQTALDSFLPLCAARGVSLIIGGPFNSGILATGVKGGGPFHYNYEPASAAVIERVRQLEALCDRYHVPLAAAALQFPLAHPQIASVIAGMANAQEAVQARAMLDLPIPAMLWDDMKKQGLVRPQAPVPLCA